MPLKPEKTSFFTQDNIKITANYWPATSKKAVILIHQFNNSKESYNSLAELLNENNYAVLAIDLRGHGESKAQGTLASPVYLQPKDFTDMNLDLKAAKEFLQEKGFNEFYLVGASIGANLAIIYPTQNTGFKAAIALSPGEDYKSLTPLPYAKKVSVSTMIVASTDDKYSFDSAKKIHSLMKCKKKLVELKNAGHGTFMLENESNLSKQILEWLNQN